ncbi:MAG: endonuclease/exonuclease/phosphatase family protein [Actinobacteria bacterium]|nr:endonuclease/exonuclease/phosphatase family protein [Actinomycetota bacterium]
MSSTATIATVNVNGVRAAFRRGMGQWLERCAPDVLLLQEVRADDGSLAALLPGWDLAHEAGAAAGRAGVAIASRYPMRAVRIGLGTEVAGDQGRWVEADLDLPDGPLTVVSVYLYSATVDHPSLDAKYAFCEHVTKRLAELGGTPAVVGGDLNIAHREVDIKNWKGNLGKAGFLPDERAYLDRWFDELGWTDVGRALGGPGPGPYTWWSWRGQAFDNDAGWRIDYQLTSPALAGAAVAARVDRAESYAARFSDHAPLVVTYDRSPRP